MSLNNVITVLPYDVTLLEVDGKQNFNFWCVTQIDSTGNSKNILLRVTTFAALCYLQLPSDIEWTSDKLQLLANYIFASIPSFANYSLQQRYKLYYYQDETTPMLLCAFHNQNGITSLRRLVDGNKGNFILSNDLQINVSIYEDNIDPVKKLLAYMKLQYSQWMRVTPTPVPDSERISTLAEEYYIDYTNITPVPELESIDWTISLKIMSFKVEVNRDNSLRRISIITTSLGNGDTRNEYQYAVNDNSDINTTVPDEATLLQRTWDLLRNYDPDIILGYESLSKTYKYLDTRVGHNNWPNLSRLKNGTTYVTHSVWSSSAYGYNNVYNLKMDGRINLDVYTFVKRTVKLNNYSLESVIEHFGLNMPTNYNAISMRAVVNTIDLFYRTDMWTECLEASNINNVSIFDLYTHGEQIRVFNNIYDTAMRNGFVINYEPQPEIGVEGAFQSAVDAGIYDNTIWYDFARLYPTIIIAYNICYTTYLNPKSEQKLDQSDVELINGVNNKVVFQSKFVKAEKRVGLLPQILTVKIAQRDVVKTQIANARSVFLRTRLEARERNLKASTNAIYGFLGVHEVGKNTLNLLVAAAVVTYLARDLITGVNDKLEVEYDAKVLYNDTDSVAFQLPGVTKNELYSRGNEILNEINKDFKAPIRLAWDKAGKFILIKQKKYVVLPYLPDGTVDQDPSHIVRRGLVTGRSDACAYAENVYNVLLNDILIDHTPSVAFNHLIENVNKLINNTIPVEDLAFSKKINTKYAANSVYFLATFLKRLKERGITIPLGTEVEYVVIATGNAKTPVAMKMELLTSLRGDEKIDVQYYIENVLETSIDQLWNIGYGETLKNVVATYKPPGTRKHAAAVTEPMKIILLQYLVGRGLDELNTWWVNNVKI